MAQVLVDSGADVHARTWNGYTPLGDLLRCLYSRQALDTLITLLRAGSSIDSCNGKGRSAEEILESNPRQDMMILKNYLSLITKVRAAGSWKNYKRTPHMSIFRIRSLRARGRAAARLVTSPFVNRLTSPDLPSVLAWKILEYWLETE